MYSKQVLDHFENPRNPGELPGATAVVEQENPVCGDVLKLSARVEGGRIAEMRFLAKGCVPAMACGSLVTTLAEGKTLEEVRGISPGQIAEALGGLPEASAHAAELAADSLRALANELGKPG